MREFGTYHPIVNFIYFVLVIGFGCIFMHPICLIISFLCGFTYSVMLKGRNGAKSNLIYMLPMIVVMAVINPLFNHEGVTIIGYFPNGNPLTAESIVYGLCAATMIVSVICHFSCYNEIMTSDRFIYLFGKVIPVLSLIISMTLRFVPRFVNQLRVVINGQKCIGRNISKGNFINRAKCGLAVLSIMITWALENAIDTADSMKARGYGLPGRSAYSVFVFDKRDKFAVILLILPGIYVFLGYIAGGMDFNYFPAFASCDISLYGVTVFCTYFLLCMFPVIIELMEVIRWNALKLKI